MPAPPDCPNRPAPDVFGTQSHPHHSVLCPGEVCGGIVASRNLGVLLWGAGALIALTGLAASLSRSVRADGRASVRLLSSGRRDLDYGKSGVHGVSNTSPFRSTAVQTGYAVRT